jgi:CheY-like chemotaxis protein
MLLSKRRIFVIEDNIHNLAIMRILLEQNGATVASERWGKEDEVLERLAGFMQVDVILLDLMFPHGVSGYDVFTRIRTRHSFATIPIIAVSAADPTLEVPKARQLGFSGFISKPVDFMQFPRQIAKVIGGESVWYNIPE